MNQKTHGFTIVELLIVIVVVGILAAISIVVYNGVSNKAHDSVVVSDAAAIAKALELYKAENGVYPRGANQFPAGLKVTKGSYATHVNNVLFCHNLMTDQYNLELVSKSGKVWWVNSGKAQERSAPSSSTATICSAVGATWANDANNVAIHGYNVNTGLWYSGWITP